MESFPSLALIKSKLEMATVSAVICCSAEALILIFRFESVVLNVSKCLPPSICPVAPALSVTVSLPSSMLSMPNSAEMVAVSLPSPILILSKLDMVALSSLPLMLVLSIVSILSPGVLA